MEFNLRKKNHFVSYYSRVNEDPAFQSIELKLQEMITKVDLQTKHLTDEDLKSNFPYTLPPEKDNIGPTEYKFYLLFSDEQTCINRATQMSHRVKNEGKGVGYYNLGVDDDGTPEGIDKHEMLQSLATLFYMARQQHMNMRLVLLARGKQGHKAYWGQVRLEMKKEEMCKQHMKITLLGRDGAGKSTLIGVFLKGKSDNGRGSARVNVFRNQNDLMLGRTTGLSHHILGFDKDGKISNYDKFGFNSYEKILENSKKLITFIDIGGNEKQNKTLVQGLSCHQPDYALLVIGASLSAKIPEDQFDLAIALKIPIILVLTKTEQTLITREDLALLNDRLRQWIQTKVPQIKSLLIEDPDQISHNVEQLKSNSVIPIFNVSNSNLQSLQNLKHFLSQLTVRNDTPITCSQDDFEFRISEIIKINGQIILAGMVIKGHLYIKQQVQIGPFIKSQNGTFHQFQIQEIHMNRVNVDTVEAGQLCSLRISGIIGSQQKILKDKDNFRKGMALLPITSKPRASRMFIASVQSFDKTTKLLNHYCEPVVTTETNIRQAAKVYIDKTLPCPEKSLLLLKRFSNPQFQMNDKIKEENKQNPEYFENSLTVNNGNVRVLFRFLQNPEYITEGTQIIIKQEGMNLIGTIDQVIFMHKRKNSSYHQPLPPLVTFASTTLEDKVESSPRLRSSSQFFNLRSRDFRKQLEFHQDEEEKYAD